ncbi:YicC/YloC family endoribonuclease [Phycisphaerales bacterium AB-hyl4]|uniref:YicC/YloC family endoribonuclease n=1 Tax=Natronomicrosphaera hydrolytica TaxID=3242702 RepID=A0ABV4U5T2_9BACT
MTGYGDASTQVDGMHFAVELRSLNNKYFKAALRLPESIAGLEAELEAALRKRVTRGSLTVTVKLRLSDAHAASRVNDAALLTYLDHLETIHSKISDHSVHIDLTQLLALPGVLQPSEDEESLVSHARPVVLKLLDQACDKLMAMRVREGKSLAEDLLTHRDLIRNRLEIIRERAPVVIDEYHQRLRSRIDELTAQAKMKIAEHDLIREVALFADRADICEELSRTAGHLEQFEQILDSKKDAPSGRTLDFLSQELLREANTIASKSNDATISRAIVEVKSAIDRIKEQVQNVE